MKRNLQLTLTSALLLVVIFFTVQLRKSVAAPTFTGNAAADFTGSTVVKVDDTEADVGMPAPDFGPDARSGWDIRAVYLDYDPATDILYVGIDCVMICGDADGDGDPNVTGPILGKPVGNGGLGGTDVANFGRGESIALLIDTNNDFTGTGGNFEVVIGVRNSDELAAFGAYQYTGNLNNALRDQSWGAKLPNVATLFASTSPTVPDLEFTVENFSTLPGFPQGQPVVAYKAYVALGSIVDDGIGEDFAPNAQSPIVITATPTEPPTLTATAVPSDTPTLTPEPSPTVTNTPVPSPTASPTPPPPTEVPETGATFATYQEWQAAQETDRLATTSYRASASIDRLFQLTIPTINLATEVFARGWKGSQQADGTIISQWDDVQYAAGWHKNSAAPGHKGNIVISGHSNIYGSIFRKLWQLKKGQSIYIDQGRVRYTYVIEEVTIAQETNALPEQQVANAAYLQQTTDNRLTLITCWPWNDSTHRVFVVAKLKNIQMAIENIQ